MMFNVPPTPEVLHWLAKGRLADRLQRSMRLWVLLHQLYGEADWAHQLPQPFRFGDVRDRLFAKSHGRSETEGVEALTATCDGGCRCQRSLETWLEESTLPSSVMDWQQDVIKLTDLAPELLRDYLKQHSFATVHRSIRDDLTYLADIGWLINEGQGRFRSLGSDKGELPTWPHMPERPPTPLGNLSVAQTWEVLRSLESISFVQPGLHVIIHSLWEQLGQQVSPARQTKQSDLEPERRIFIHLDYILTDTLQDHVDTLQEQIERLWREQSQLQQHAKAPSIDPAEGGVIQFDYWRKSGKTLRMTVYPVCLHYARRAKYLSAYGHDPAGEFTWHNYRLDRIASPQLKVLPWNEPDIPTALLAMKKAGNLPTSKEVETYLEAAWGFNFYLPRRLLIMRFTPEFARWYVHETDRHPTFVPVAYEALPRLVKQEIADPQVQKAVLNILAQRSPEDVYYQAWIRLGDINIVMRLRDWRPNGEVIAPFELREQMKEECVVERSHYETEEF